MRSFALGLALLAAGCARGTAPAYAPEDPLAGAPKIETFYRVLRATEPAAVFRAALPEGYARMEGRLNAPVAAIFTKPVHGGEASLIVERYGGEWGEELDRESFLRNLTPAGQAPPAGRHALAGREFLVYHGLDFERYTHAVQAGDPYADYLGRRYPPPRLSLFENRRFAPGGQAYRLYRCRKLGAWGMLADYNRALRSGRLGEFRRELQPADRRVLAACFGNHTLLLMETGKPAKAPPKPSLYKLRAIAREEWTMGASRSVERECVSLIDLPAGFLALRLRAPRHAFADEHAAFELFLGSFVPGEL